MKIRHSFSAATVLLALLGTLAGTAFSDVWVSASGSNGNDGLSVGAPKQTVAAAITVWNGQSVGSDLHVLGGGVFTATDVYDISISGQTGNTARIFGDGSVATLRSMVFNIIGASVEFSNLVLECTGATQGAFRIQNTGTNLTLNQLAIYGDPHCIHIDDGQGSGTLADGLTITNSYLQAANNGDALNIDVGVLTTNLKLDSVVVLRLGTAGGGNEVAVLDTTLPNRNITVRNCNISAAQLANPNAGTLIIAGSPAMNVRVENTVVFTAANFALRTGGFTNGMIVRDCTLTSWYTTIQFYNAPIKNLTIENCSLYLTGTRNADRNDNIALEQTWTVPAWVSNAVEGSRDLANVVVRNCRLSGGSSGIYLMGTTGTGVRYKMRNMVFENLTITNKSRVPIYVLNCDIQDVTFSNITVSQFSLDCIDVVDTDGSGLYFSHIVADCGSQGAGYEGVWADCLDNSPAGLQNLVVENSVFANPNYDGIRVVSDVDNVTVRNNTVIGRCVGDAAIKLSGQAGKPHYGARVTGNTISNVAKGGMLVASPWSDVIFSNNVLANVAGNGIEAYDGSTTDILSGVQVSGNLVYSVSGGVAIKVQGRSIRVSQNKVANAPIGIHVSPGSGPLSSPEINHGTDVKVFRNAILAGTGTGMGIVMTAPLGINFGAGNAIYNNTVDGYPVGMDFNRAGNTAKVYNDVLTGNGVGIQLAAGAGPGPSFTFNGFAANTSNNTGFAAVGHKDAFYNILDAPFSYLSTDVNSAVFLKLPPGSQFIDQGSLDGVLPDPTPDPGDDIDMGWIESAASRVDGWRLW